MPSSADKRASGLFGAASFSPWGSRSTTPKPGQTGDDAEGNAQGGLGKQRGGDHAVTHRHRLSLRSYPADCPKANVLWYHAVDSPKRKPLPSGKETKDIPPPPPPKKYVPFSVRDSKAIEAAFQKLAEEEEAAEQRQLQEVTAGTQIAGEQPVVPLNVSLKGEVKIPVNEDFLFDVDVQNRELGPAYWLGPVYDVRRGTWFYWSSAGLTPCDENLATQLEEGFMKVRPWTFSAEEQAGAALKATAETPKSPDAVDGQADSSEQRTKTFRLFGAHMSSMVTYQNATTAWLLTDDFLSRMNQNMYERFAGGGHFAGVKLVRGYSDPKKMDAKDPKKAADPPKQAATEKGDPDSPSLQRQSTEGSIEAPSSATEKRRMRLERQMSALVESVVPEDRERQEEEERRRNEEEMEDDYRDDDNNQQGREIEHLILVTHGIGQRLGLRMESVNFVHDVNTMRRTFKDVYSESPDLQALNGDIDREIKNTRIQMLPVCWRHLLDFPRQSLKHNREEHDLGDADVDDGEYPAFEDINVEGVPAVRNLMTDLALDVLLYQSPAYKGHITRIVLEEANRVYNLFKTRNPHFKGRISFVGHSLGSAIMFDILCRQPDAASATTRSTKKKNGRQTDYKLDFTVDDFYALGSPLGLFQMLKGRTIAARSHGATTKVAETPGDEEDFADGPFHSASLASNKARGSLVDITTSSPACAQVYNIFHPTDPIAYRLEPLISSAMAQLKPQPLPYTKKGLFGAPVGQGLTGIGARVGQSFSGMWSSVSSSIAGNLLNRSLGLPADQAGKVAAPLPHSRQQRDQYSAKAPEVGADVQNMPDPAILTDERKQQLAQDQIAPGEAGEHPQTLIDADLDTLYAGFQRHVAGSTDEAKDESGGDTAAEKKQAVEEQARRLRREEQKVRALNANGRVDYAIQEGAFDISLFAIIASHLSYWGDEDVAHFMISQLLARHRVHKKSKSRASQQ